MLTVLAMVALPGVAGVAGVAGISNARAGDRQLAILFVDMTPDAASGAASSRCGKHLRATFRAGYTELQRMGETRARKLIKRPKGGAPGSATPVCTRQPNRPLGSAGAMASPAAPFMAWTGPMLKPLRERDAFWADAAILSDCRPTRQQLDILIAPASGAATRIHVRHTALTDERLTRIAEAALHAAWHGFPP